jgi:hypothetical protein
MIAQGNGQLTNSPSAVREGIDLACDVASITHTPEYFYVDSIFRQLFDFDCKTAAASAPKSAVFEAAP